MMRVVVRALNEDAFYVLLTKIKGKGLKVRKENKKSYLLVVEIPKSEQAVLYELLELNAIIQRDTWRDLD